jgi:hypothetical protein
MFQSGNMENNAERILGLDELTGLKGLGMKREALREVRRLLKSRDMTGDDFNKALNAILGQVDKLKSWTVLVEAAYARLPEHERENARFMLVSFRNCIRNYEGVLQLLPSPDQIDAGEFALIELGFGMEAAMKLNKMELAEKLAGWFPKAMQAAESPTLQSILRLTQAEFFIRAGKWEDAVALFESVQNDRIFCRDAVKGIVEIHAFHALLAIKNGLTFIEKFNRDFEPEMEITLPGNDKVIQQKAERQFRKWRKTLEKIVPEKRQKELGIK